MAKHPPILANRRAAASWPIPAQASLHSFLLHHTHWIIQLKYTFSWQHPTQIKASFLTLPSFTQHKPKSCNKSFPAHHRDACSSSPWAAPSMHLVSCRCLLDFCWRALTMQTIYKHTCWKSSLPLLSPCILLLTPILVTNFLGILPFFFLNTNASKYYGITCIPLPSSYKALFTPDFCPLFWKSLSD